MMMKQKVRVKQIKLMMKKYKVKCVIFARGGTCLAMLLKFAGRVVISAKTMCGIILFL